MGPKRGGRGKKGKKEKKALTDEEKVFKAQIMALKAEEVRRKKEQERIARFQQLQAREEQLCHLNMRKIQTHWRKILRTSKVTQLRKRIHLLAQEHEHQVANRDTMIKTCMTDWEEAAAQQQMSYARHLQNLDGMFDLHYVRLKSMDENFHHILEVMQKEFDAERDGVVAGHARHKKEMGDMMNKMGQEFDELRLEQHQEFEANREELRNKSAEEYNVMKISLEGQVEELERRIECAHQQYLASTETKTQAFKELSIKDAIDSRLIEQRMRKLIHLHELLAMWRAKIASNSKEWDAANKAVREEKEQINGHYQDLKKTLARLHKSEHEKLKAISIASGKITVDLKAKLEKADRLIRLSLLNSKLETEHEKIFPFDPLHCSTMSRVADEEEGDVVGAEFFPKKDLGLFAECGVGSKGEGVQERVSVSRQGSSGAAVPRLSLQNGKEVAAAAAAAAVQGCGLGGLRLGTFSVNDAGEVVDEEEYLSRFSKRVSKVQLDKLSVEMEKWRLIEDNSQLQSALEIYLNGITINEEALQGPLNTLLIVNRSLYQRAS